MDVVCDCAGLYVKDKGSDVATRVCGSAEALVSAVELVGNVAGDGRPVDEEAVINVHSSDEQREAAALSGIPS